MAQGTCSIPDCGKAGPLTRTWCVNHYAKWRRWGDPLGSRPPRRESCEIEGCTRGGRFVRGLCSTHAYRVSVHGDPLADVPIREANAPDATCAIGGCDRGGLLRRGWCTLHYQRWEKHGDPEREPPTPILVCTIDGCGQPHVSKSLCGTHYMRLLRTGTTELRERPTVLCAVEGCDRPRASWDWCTRHYLRWRKYGDPLKTQRERENNPPDFCTLSKCNEPHHAKGLCQDHYSQLRYEVTKDATRARHREHYRNNREYYYARTTWRQRVKVDCMDELDKLLSVEYRHAIKRDPCFYCGQRTSQMHTDHFFPIHLGGTDHWDNLVRACSACNWSKSAHCGTWFILKVADGGKSWLTAAVA